MTDDPAGGAGTLYGVTGATGGVGSRVAARLAAAGVHQRLVVRDRTRAPRLANSEVAQAEYRDGDAMRAALAGVHTLLLVSASESADRVDEHRSAVAAARDAGVRRVVYTSFLGAAPDCTFSLGRHHWATEEALRASGMGFTALRDSMYADFIPYLVSPDDRTIRGPAGDGVASFVARDDIADVAVALMLSDGSHDSDVLDTTGPQALSLQQVADLLGELTGRPVHYVAETVEEAYASRARYQAPDWEVEGWVTSYTSIAAGEMATVADTVPRLAGHAATSVRDLLTADPRTLAALT